MKTPPEKAIAIQSPFDEWTKAVAHGLTRRKSLQLLGGGLSGALLALGLPKSWGAPTPSPGCGHICAPLAPPASTQTAFELCKDKCEDCKSCQGTPSLTTTNALVCTNATPCRSASGLACCEPDQNCCGVVCCDVDFFDCCAGTCLTRCPAGQSRDPKQNCACVCDSGVACNGGCCSSGQDCCGGNCLTPCPSPGSVRDASTCQCVPFNGAQFTCANGSSQTLGCQRNSCEGLKTIATTSVCSAINSTLSTFTCTPC
jgi:hypothetical protein